MLTAIQDTDLSLYKDQTLVIKYGGNAMTSTKLSQMVAQDIVTLNKAGIRVVVVHGGGPQVDELLTAIGHTSKRIDGMRVTDSTTMQAVTMVLGGSVNSQLVGMINQAGGKAVGLTGKDGKLITAQHLVGKNDLGFVGEITQVNHTLLTVLVNAGYIPVIAPIASDDTSTDYNINADIVAGAIAHSIGADELMLLTNIDGVLDSSGQLVDTLTYEQITALIQDGTIYGGMIPKLSGAIDAINAGLPRVSIINGCTPNACLRKLLGDKIGTTIVSTKA